MTSCKLVSAESGVRLSLAVSPRSWPVLFAKKRASQRGSLRTSMKDMRRTPFVLWRLTVKSQARQHVGCEEAEMSLSTRRSARKHTPHLTNNKSRSRYQAAIKKCFSRFHAEKAVWLPKIPQQQQLQDPGRYPMQFWDPQ